VRKSATVVILLIVSLTLFILSHNVYAKDYVVKKVIDGDTVQLDTGETVRYLGIDAPEVFTKGGGAEFYAREDSTLFPLTDSNTN